MFDFSTLVTDRTNADVSYLAALMARGIDTWTPEELEQFNAGMLKGGYFWTDLNRVISCMDYMNEELSEMGYITRYTPTAVPWSDADAPTAKQISVYLENIKKIRSTLSEIPENPDVPESLVGMTVETANRIEEILINIQNMVENIKGTVNLGWAIGISDIGLYGGL